MKPFPLILALTARTILGQDAFDHRPTALVPSAPPDAGQNNTVSSASSATPTLRMIDTKRGPKSKEWVPQPVHTLADVGDLGTAAPALDTWGGRTDRKLNATGFFRVTQDQGRWTLVDPEGHPFLTVGMCTVATTATDVAKEALLARFGSKEGWAKTTHDLLRGAGFNTLGCWSDAAAFTKLAPRMAYTPQLDVASSFAAKIKWDPAVKAHTGSGEKGLPVFHPGWPGFCESYIAERVAATKDDPALLGYFSDNELTFSPKALDVQLKLPEDAPGRIAAEQWLKGRHVESAQISDADRQAFLAYYADAYFGPIAKALKTHDPRHLYLGSRFWSGDVLQKPLFEAAGRHCDVISVNWYRVWDSRHPTPDRGDPKRWAAWSGKPFFISEFYSKGEDSGMGNTTGGGWLVKTQAERGLFYQTFTLGMLEETNCVGWHYFKYQDNDPTNKKADPSNADSNKGMVDNRYKPWTAPLEAAGAVNAEVYRLRDHFIPAK